MVMHAFVQTIVSFSPMFFTRLHADQAPALCLRHDVDGLLWQPRRWQDSAGSHSDSSLWQHVGTIHAFGYVQASKTQRRFTVCAPDMSFTAIADCSRHIYIYRPNVALASSSALRNRNSGDNVTSVAKLHVISLDTPDVIHGLYASSSHIFLSTATHMYAVSLLTQTS